MSMLIFRAMRTRHHSSLSRAAILTLAALAAVAMLAGCGTKGPLYVPVHQPDASAPVARPAVPAATVPAGAEPIVAPAAPAATTSSDSKSTAAPAAQ